jgi:hypothetical protein
VDLTFIFAQKLGSPSLILTVSSKSLFLFPPPPRCILKNSLCVFVSMLERLRRVFTLYASRGDGRLNVYGFYILLRDAKLLCNTFSLLDVMNGFSAACGNSGITLSALPPLINSHARFFVCSAQIAQDRLITCCFCVL